METTAKRNARALPSTQPVNAVSNSSENVIQYNLRPWSMNDLSALVKHANNFNIANNLTDRFPYPYTEEDGKAYLNMVCNASKDLVLCIEVNGEAAGSIGIHHRKDVYRKNSEIGYWLAELYWGKGIMSSVIEEVVTKAFDQFDIERIFAPVFGRNKTSQRVLQKHGFDVEARFKNTIFKNGKFEDEVVLAIRRTQWEKR